MRIVYVASDQRVPGRTGGSVHVLEVARGLAARGHEVHVVVHREAGLPVEGARDGIIWHRVAWRPDHRIGSSASGPAPPSSASSLPSARTR